MLQRSRILPLSYLIPLHSPEEQVLLQFRKSDSFSGLLLQQSDQHIPEIMTDEAHDIIQDFFDVHAFDVGLNDVVVFCLVAFEGIFLEFEFVHKNPDGPKVDFLAVLSVDDFRGGVLEGANEGAQDILFLNDHFGEAVVREFDVSLVGDENVLRLEFPVDDAAVVEDFDSDDDFSEEHFNDFLLEDKLLAAEVEVDVAAGQVLHHDVYLVFVLECLPDGDEQLLHRDLPDQLALQHIELLDLVLLDNLHRVLDVVLLVLRQHHISKRPLPQVLDALIVIRPVPNQIH